MLDQTGWHAHAYGYFWVHRATGGAQCASSNLVVDGHTDVVADPGLVIITVNHRATEMVADPQACGHGDYKWAQ